VYLLRDNMFTIYTHTITIYFIVFLVVTTVICWVAFPISTYYLITFKSFVSYFKLIAVCISKYLVVIRFIIRFIKCFIIKRFILSKVLKTTFSRTKLCICSFSFILVLFVCVCVDNITIYKLYTNYQSIY